MQTPVIKYGYLLNIPQEIVEYVEGMMDNYSCADKIRIAIKGDKESEKVYESIRAKGCCGFMDYQMIPFKVGGKEFYYGFNYGH